MDPKDYMKQLGRDGSYAEYDVSQLHELLALIKEDKPFPKMLVLKAGRLELSNPQHISQFKKLLIELTKCPEIAEMSPEQQGFYIFRTIFEYGLDDQQ